MFTFIKNLYFIYSPDTPENPIYWSTNIEDSSWGKGMKAFTKKVGMKEGQMQDIFMRQNLKDLITK